MRQRRVRSVLVLSCLSWAFQAQAADLKLSVEGVKDEQGQFLVAVYKEADSFLDAKKALKETIVKVSDAKQGITLGEMPAGTYAVAVIHDKNSNGKLDTNFLGIPKEPFGTSQNAPSRFGPPSFDQSKFDLSDALTLSIQLREY